MSDTYEITKKAVEHFGATMQIDVAIEEMGELISALIQLRRGRVCERDVVEEVADVCLTMESLKHIFGHDRVNEIMKLKTHRLNRRVTEMTVEIERLTEENKKLKTKIEDSGLL
jgi:vacuolar-type H+-ATPase subunit D/Vma8